MSFSHYQRVMMAISGVSLLILFNFISSSDNFFVSKPIKAPSSTIETKSNTKLEREPHWTAPCKYRTLETNSDHPPPTPVILISLGRSGSSITWDTITALTGGRNTAFEVTGGNPTTSLEFFDKLLNDSIIAETSNPKRRKVGVNQTQYLYNLTNWTLQTLCHVQRIGRPDRPDISSNSRIIGFQWKPFVTTWNHSYAIAGLKAVSERNHRHGTGADNNVNDDANIPAVKVLYLTRNALDRKLSNLRHSQTKTLDPDDPDAVPAHCAVGDEECLNKHSKATQNITFPKKKKLLQWLRSFDRQNANIVNRLRDLDVPFLEVSYKELYSSDDDSAEEWMRIFRFLGEGPKEGLTMDSVRGVFTMASTHKKSRNETIDNFEDVVNALTGTKFEYLLSD